MKQRGELITEGPDTNFLFKVNTNKRPWKTSSFLIIHGMLIFCQMAKNDNIFEYSAPQNVQFPN